VLCVLSERSTLTEGWQAVLSVCGSRETFVPRWLCSSLSAASCRHAVVRCPSRTRPVSSPADERRPRGERVAPLPSRRRRVSPRPTPTDASQSPTVHRDAAQNTAVCRR